MVKRINRTWALSTTAKINQQRNFDRLIYLKPKREPTYGAPILKRIHTQVVRFIIAVVDSADNLAFLSLIENVW
jgi:hypothetical protein